MKRFLSSKSIMSSTNNNGSNVSSSFPLFRSSITDIGSTMHNPVLPNTAHPTQGPTDNNGTSPTPMTVDALQEHTRLMSDPVYRNSFELMLRANLKKMSQNNSTFSSSDVWNSKQHE